MKNLIISFIFVFCFAAGVLHGEELETKIQFEAVAAKLGPADEFEGYAPIKNVKILLIQKNEIIGKERFDLCLDQGPEKLFKFLDENENCKKTTSGESGKTTIPVNSGTYVICAEYFPPYDGASFHYSTQEIIVKRKSKPLVTVVFEPWPAHLRMGITEISYLRRILSAFHLTSP